MKRICYLTIFTLLVLNAHAFAGTSGFIGLDTAYNQTVNLTRAIAGLVALGLFCIAGGAYATRHWETGTISVVSGVMGLGVVGYAPQLVTFIDAAAGAVIW